MTKKRKNHSEIGQKQYLSLNYLASSINLINKLKLIEELELNQLTSEIKYDYDTFRFSSIILSNAFLEATINELLGDISENVQIIREDGSNQHFDKSFTNNIRKLTKGNDFRFGNLRVESKYNLVLILTGKTEFMIKDSYLKEFNNLRILRNDLIHADSEWVWDDPELLKKLKTKRYEDIFKQKFNPNPFVKGGPFFPNRCLGHGCSKWALLTCLNFSDEFYKRMELKPLYEPLRDLILSINKK